SRRRHTRFSRDWSSDVCSSDLLDADLLDYLRRDSYFAGLRQDYDDRIYSYFCIEDGQLACDLTKRGLERHDARSEIVHLLRMRYFLTERVYFHHAKVISGARSEEHTSELQSRENLVCRL